MPLTSLEQARYQRHLILPGFGEAAQERLKKASILVIGAGGLGCPALLYLGGAGFGKIGIVDHDTVSESNLHRQVLYTGIDIGQLKAEVAAQKLKQQNPYIQIESIPELLDQDNVLQLFEDYDMVMDGSDNFSTRYLVSDACVLLDKPLISGSIFTFEGQVSVFNYQDGPTYRCLFPEPPSAHEMPNCSDIGVLGVLPGVVGTIMATEAIKIATGIGETLSGKLLVYDALQMSFHTLAFALDPANKKITSLTNYDFSCDVPAFLEMTWEEYRAQQHGLQLVDVRERHEHAHFHIGGLNLPLSELKELVHLIAKDKTVVLHCQSGIRSRKAILLLQEQFGFTNLVNLKNGLQEVQFN